MKKLLFAIFLLISFASLGQGVTYQNPQPALKGIRYQRIKSDSVQPIPRRLLTDIDQDTTPHLFVYADTLYQWINGTTTKVGAYAVLDKLDKADSLFNVGYTRRDRAQWMIDSLGVLKFNISDTSAMLSNYPRLDGTRATGTWNINVTGTAASETLATVTGRGASTSTQIVLTGFNSTGNLRLSSNPTGIEFFNTTGTVRNWQISAQSINNQSIDFTPSTENGGTIYSTPIFSLDALNNRIITAASTSMTLGATAGTGTGIIYAIGTGLTGTAAELSIGGTAAGETLATVTGRGNTTSTGVSLTENGNLATSYALYLKRNTDTSPLGYLIQAQNVAATINLFTVDVSGNVNSNGTMNASNFSGTSSGTNTGDQTITLTGNVTGSGTGSFATTIAAGVVTTAMMASANISQWTNNSGYLTSSTGVTTFSAGTTGLTPAAATSGAITLAGTLAIANGGTGSTTAQGAINTLAGAVTSAQYLRGNGTNVVMSAIQVSDVPTLNQNTTGNASTATTLQTARAINGVNFDGSAAITITANTTNALTIGTDLSGTSFNGSAAVTIANTSTLATVTGRGATTSTGISLTESGNLSTSYALYLKRNTDTGPLGYLIQAQNNAANANLFTVDVSGNIIGAGTIGASNFSGTSSGTNTGDQTITLTGGVTGSGVGSFAATVVTNANLTGIVTSTGNATSIAGNAITDGYIASAATWNAKQAAYTNLTSIGALVNGAGWLYNNGTGTFSYSTPTAANVGAPSGSGTSTGTNTGDETTTRINALYGYTPANPALYLPLTGGTLTGNLTGTSLNLTGEIQTSFGQIAMTNTSGGGVPSTGVGIRYNGVMYIYPGSTAFSIRNNANNSDNLLVLDNGNTSITGSLTAGAISGTTGTFSDVITGQVNGNTFGASGATGRAVIIQAGSTNQAIQLKNSSGGDGTISATGTSTSLNYSFNTYSVADAFFIANGGNVGIGTASPVALLDVNGTATFAGSVTASSFIKSGGTSSQFLKADGSVDENAYEAPLTFSTGLSRSVNTITNTGVLSVISGTDIVTDGSTGNVTINNNSTLATVTGRGSVTTTAITASWYAQAIISVTTTYSVATNIGTVFAQASADYTITLPAAESYAGRTVTIVRTDSNLSFAITISGATWITSLGCNSTVTYRSNGTTWYAVSYYNAGCA